MAAYVPPHARERLADISADDDRESSLISGRRLSCMTANEFRTEEIQKYFWPDYDPSCEHVATGTLNGCAASPNSLRYVMLFRGANPRWRSYKTIFVKSKLHLLGLSSSNSSNDKREDAVMGELQETNDTSGNTRAEPTNIVSSTASSGADPAQPNSTQSLSTNNGSIKAPQRRLADIPNQAIPIFECKEGTPSNIFKFVGYHRVVKVDHLKPRSPELIEMMQQKWSSRSPASTLPIAEDSNEVTANSIATLEEFPRREQARDPESWARSLNTPWAVVQFEQLTTDELEESGLLTPDLKILDLPARKYRSRQNRNGRGHGGWSGSGARDRRGGSRARGGGRGYGVGREGFTGVSDMLTDMSLDGEEQSQRSQSRD